MGLLDRFTKKVETINIAELEAVDDGKAKGTPSSTVNDNGVARTVVRPEVSFAKQFEFYRTVGKIQNSIDGDIDKIVTRDWYFASADDNKPYEEQVEKMNDWAKKYKLRWLLRQWLRNCKICGNMITSKRDWLPMQMTSIDGLVRDEFGRTEYFVQVPSGNNQNASAFDLGTGKPRYPADDYIHNKYIDLDRQAWGLAQFHAIMNDNWQDPDLKTVKSTLAGYRVMMQDFFKIIHKYGSPRVFYYVETVGSDIFDKQIKPALMRLKAGGRIALDKKITVEQETVDGNARFMPYVEKIDEEIQTGAKSATNRLITQPSAMADAKSANEVDDERAKADMDLTTAWINDDVVPVVLGPDWQGKIEFHWGKQDDFEYDPNEWLEYVKNKVVSPLELREILKENGGKLNDTLFKNWQAEIQAHQDEMMKRQQEEKKKPNPTVEAITEAAKKISEL